MNLAAVRIRGVNRVSHPIERTLQQLHLHRKNFCVVIPDTPSFQGMLALVKDYIAYGPIDDETYTVLLEKRGQVYTGPISDERKKVSYASQYVEIENKKYKPFFRLHPPRGGFDRKGTKKAHTLGGALGFREDIKKLLLRMV